MQKAVSSVQTLFAGGLEGVRPLLPRNNSGLSEVRDPFVGAFGGSLPSVFRSTEKDYTPSLHQVWLGATWVFPGGSLSVHMTPDAGRARC